MSVKSRAVPCPFVLLLNVYLIQVGTVKIPFQGLDLGHRDSINHCLELELKGG